MKDCDSDSEDSENPMSSKDITVYSLWDTIVIRYTKANLVVALDKLVALSGVAKETQMMMGDEYMARL
jgi:hypothetical protein